MPYAYIHEFDDLKVDVQVSLWERICNSLPIKVLTNTEVLSVRSDSSIVNIDAKHINGGEVECMEFDKIIISGSFPFKNVKAYRSPTSISRGLSNFFFFVCVM